MTNQMKSITSDFSVASDENVIHIRGSCNSRQWLADTGSSYHLCTNKSLFIEYHDGGDSV